MSNRSKARGQLELRRIQTIDGQSFRSLYPGDDAEVDYAVQLTIGRSGEAEEIVFRVRIVSADALLGQADDEFRVLAHRGTIVVRTFDWRDVLTHIEGILAKCEAERLQGSLTLLRRYFVEEAVS